MRLATALGHALPGGRIEVQLPHGKLLRVDHDKASGATITPCELRAMLGWFSYFNVDPANIRNRTASGGGALMDVGCYLLNTSRFIFDREPTRAIGAMESNESRRSRS